MNILLVGSGGREHALAWSLSKSESCTKLFCAPGNAGISEHATCIDIAAEDHDALVRFCKTHTISFVVVGPEPPLVAGLVDVMRKENITVFGPDKIAAQLEGSKGFMKDLCAKYDIPTAAYKRFNNAKQAYDYIDTLGAPVVIKADGLAAGKGVIIAQTVEEARKAVDDMLKGQVFGLAGAEIVIEEFMDGEELSFFAISDGDDFVSFASAQDHKRVFDGDEGPNTGGMGAYSPAHFMTPNLETKIIDTIIAPTVKAMKAEGCPFQGVLYAGLMLVDGEPRLIEYNIRFGDPECQPMLMRLETDLVEILYAAANGQLSKIKNTIQWSDETALCVVMAARGYPSSYEKGTEIRGAEKLNDLEEIKLFHAGTLRDNSGALINSGGRVLNIVAKASDVEMAQQKAYEMIEHIDWPEGFYRSDIGWRAVKAAKDKAA